MPLVVGLACFYRLGGGVFELFFLPRGGEFAHQKNFLRGFATGGWSGLELTDTSLTCLKAEIFSEYCLFSSNMEDRYTIYVFY